MLWAAITRYPQSPRLARPNACARPSAWSPETAVPPKPPPARPDAAVAEACPDTESAVISPLKSEMFEAFAVASTAAVFFTFTPVAAEMPPVTTTDPSAGYA